MVIFNEVYKALSDELITNFISKKMISIIIPAYNQSEFLNETLESVIKQTSSDWECIIVNDGSTDLTETIAKQWVAKDSRFRYFFKNNGGLSSARNYGIQQAKYDYVFPLDADDLIAANLVEEVLKVFKTTDADVVCFNSSFFGAKTGRYTLPDYSYKTMLLQNCFIACTPFKKSIYTSVGGYDENLKSFEDWDFWIRALDATSIVVKIEATLFYYRKHNTGSLTNKFSETPKLYYELYDYIYTKNKRIYDNYFKNPILAYQENELLAAFNNKIKNTFAFKLYIKFKKLL